MVTRLLPLLLVGCALETTSDVDRLDAEAWVVRASLDLRGVRPTLDEIRAVHADPAAAEALVASFVDDPRFPDRLADLYAELFLTRTEDWSVDPGAFGLVDELDRTAFVQDVGDEPLQILAEIARADLPWTEAVLGDWTMATPVLSRVHPVDRDDGEGWTRARYTDGRPAAGVLATNGLWWRYGSTPSNANRGRAAQVSRLFLCVDYAEVSVPFDGSLDLLDEEAVAAAIREDRSCAACHDQLDPLAGYLYGFWYPDPGNPLDIVAYHPEREQLWKDLTGVAPAIDDEPGYALRDLGRALAADEAFPGCAVEQAWDMLVRREPGDDEEAGRIAVRNAFVAQDLSIRALYRTLVTTDAYRRVDEAGVGLRVASPDLLAAQIEDLTGFRMVLPNGWDLLATDRVGVKGLAGGADGRTTTRNADAPNATMVLVQERLAELAAAHVVVADWSKAPADRHLLHQVDIDAPTDDLANVRAQLVDLHARIFGRDVTPDGAQVEAHLELWTALVALHDDPVEAWTGVVAAFLRDPDLLLY